MNKITQCKAQITRAYNSGSAKVLKDFIPIIEKNEITGMEYVEYILPHIEKILASPPKKSKNAVTKKSHDKWYVYFYFLNNDLHPVYIGKTYNIENRLKAHKKEEARYNKIKTVLYIEFNSETDALDYERYYTEHFQPDWNISNKGLPPSYKLPVQQLQVWVPIIHDISKMPEIKELYDYSKQIANFTQMKINAVSNGF